MDHPERPSRHRNHDKWKRIIEPAGDSDSSEWSSDSDVTIGVNKFHHYPYLDSSVGNGSSSNANGEQLSPIDASMNGSGGQTKSSFFRSLENYSFVFDPVLDRKRFPVLDPAPGQPTNIHLLHHDYAERDVNNDRGVSDTSWFGSNLYDSLLPMGRKRKWMMSNRTEAGSAPEVDTNAPSTSSSIVAVLANDEGTAQDVDTNPTVTAAENQDDEDRWRLASSSRNIVSSPSRKRVQYDTTEAGESSTSVPLPTTSQHDCVVTTGGSLDTLSSRPISPPSFFLPPDYSFQKLHRSYKRLSEALRREQNSVPEDYSLPGTRPSEDASEVQVLSMAGPSSSSSRIAFPRLAPQEAEVMEELPPSQPVVEAEDEGVEIITVEDAQPKPPTEKKTSQDVPTKEEKLLRSEDEYLNQGLIGLLECPVCMEYMGPPIRQCRRGHLVCSTCKPKLPNCPTCRTRFTESRNLAMEKVAEKLHYPCKNAHFGCDTTLRLRDKNEHEANCSFRSYRCIMVPPCEWKGQHQDILPHVKQAHASALLQGTEHFLEMHLGNFTEQSSQNWVISALGELFRVNLGAVRGGRVQVFGCVLLLGPARRAPQFRYTLTVGPAEGDMAQRKMTYSRTTHCYVERCSVYYSAGDSFHLRTESAQLFSTGPSHDRIMRVKLQIEKTDS